MLAPVSLNLWSEAVLHVLAHVSATAPFAASLFDADYVAAMTQALGPPQSRTLAEDAACLGRLLVSHDALVRAQTLAWLFQSPERALAFAASDLADLPPDAVDRPDVLALLASDPTAELLRAAAELELPGLASLAPLHIDTEAFALALDEVTQAAPRLRESRVRWSRVLGWRGRVMGDEIWVGVRSLEHAAFQAAHEATVAEVLSRGVVDHAQLEREALVLLTDRARRTALEPRHARWLSFYAPTISDARDTRPRRT